MENKLLVAIRLSKQDHLLAKNMAKKDNRSFSNWVAVLILKELETAKTRHESSN